MKFQVGLGKRLNSASLAATISLLLPIFFSLTWTAAVSADNQKASPEKKTGASVLQVKVYAATCLACVRRIERHLRQNPAILNVTVKIATSSYFTINYDQKKISEKDILQLIEKEGYRVEKVQTGGKVNLDTH